MEQILDYHLRELAVARDPSHRNHLMPPIRPEHRAILDIGCGMGQTLIAAGLSPQTNAYGIDTDAAAIDAGLAIAPANIQLIVGSGEHLDFPDGFFDFIICRVALPYMRVDKALAEMSRVLRPGGQAWLVLHSARMCKRRALESYRRNDWKDVLFSGFVAANSLLLHTTGRQLTVQGRTETFQTSGGMRRALARAGLECLKLDWNSFSVAEVRKPIAGGAPPD